jgi:hypothetical protein
MIVRALPCGDKKAETDLQFDNFHKLTATIYRARASDIRAGLDVAV